MTRERIGRTISVFLMAMLASGNGAVASPLIEPISASVHFSRSQAAQGWSRYITTQAGEKRYVLSLEPDYAVGDYLIGVNLVLRATGDRDADSNLLSPSHSHGMQPYIFNALDLQNGIEKSDYGAVRNMVVEKAGLTVTVTLIRAKVAVVPHSPLPAASQFPEQAKMWSSYPQLEDLWFDVRVEPLNSSNQRGSRPQS